MYMYVCVVRLCVGVVLRAELRSEEARSRPLAVKQPCVLLPSHTLNGYYYYYFIKWSDE